MHCQVIQMTPTGRGAVTSLLVDGRDATSAVQRLFQPASSNQANELERNRICYGRWTVEQGECDEQVVVCRRGSQRVEVHCHGGPMPGARIIGSLVDLGCQRVSWRALADREHGDPLAAEARVALASAPTERTAMILLDQYQGTLRREIEQVCAGLEGGAQEDASARLALLHALAGVGMHLIQPWRVVLAGRPNVGKSSLMNALAGYRRSIVTNEPGTTRDVVSIETALDGWPVQLSDTAGLRATAHQVESAGVGLARGHVAAADLVVMVVDASQESPAPDQALIEANANSFTVHNKSDLDNEGVYGRTAELMTSALTGEGIDRLAAEIKRRLVPNEPTPGAAVPFTPAQIAAVRDAVGAVARNDAAAAVARLRQVAPPVTS